MTTPRAANNNTIVVNKDDRAPNDLSGELPWGLKAGDLLFVRVKDEDRDVKGGWTDR